MAKPVVKGISFFYLYKLCILIIFTKTLVLSIFIDIFYLLFLDFVFQDRFVIY